jgi:hypothetical protein
MFPFIRVFDARSNFAGLQREVNMDMQLLVDALKAFEAMKPGMEGMIAAGTLVSASAKTSVYVIQKGARLISYLITGAKKKKKLPASSKADKAARSAIEEPKVTKTDVAIIVDINHRSLRQVAAYLEAQGIDADLIIITNDPNYGDKVHFLDPQKPQDWDMVVRDFGAAILKIEKAVGSARVHIFQSTPLPLSFALGCAWGTVHPATIYHYEGGTYHPVLSVDRAWKQG